MKDEKQNLSILIYRLREVIEDISQSQGKTFKDIADDLQISAQDVTNYTRTRTPGLKLLMNVSTTYHIPLEYLVGLSDIKKYTDAPTIP